MSNIYNIEINALNGTSIDLGEFNINKTDIKDIKKELGKQCSVSADNISFSMADIKENTIYLDIVISQTPSDHVVYGNKYIDDLTIREVLNHIELYGTPEDSHIFTDIGAKTHYKHIFHH